MQKLKLVLLAAPFAAAAMIAACGGDKTPGPTTPSTDLVEAGSDMPSTPDMSDSGAMAAPATPDTAAAAASAAPADTAMAAAPADATPDAGAADAKGKGKGKGKGKKGAK